jgi:hypothetical protein
MRPPTGAPANKKTPGSPSIREFPLKRRFSKTAQGEMPNGGYTKGAPRQILTSSIRVMSWGFVPEKSLWNAPWSFVRYPGAPCARTKVKPED